MKVFLIALETILLFVALGFAIPAPSSTEELTPMAPAIYISTAAFFSSRALRHGIFENKRPNTNLIVIGYAAFEALIFYYVFVTIHVAAQMIP